MHLATRVLLGGSLTAAALPPGTAMAEPDGCLRYPNAVLEDLGLHVVNAGYQRTINCHLVLQATAGLYAPWMVNDDVLGWAVARGYRQAHSMSSASWPHIDINLGYTV